MPNQNSTSNDLFLKLKSHFPSVKLGDAQGMSTVDPNAAVFFDFDFNIAGEKIASVSISIADPGSLKIFYSRDILTNQSDIVKQEWFSFLKDIRNFSKKKLLSFDPKDITKKNLDKRDYKFLASRNKDAAMSESSLYGSTRSSYQKLENTKLIIRHSKKIEEDGINSRTRNIQSLYVESADGERFKYPFTHLAGARAMQRHVANGGNPYDSFGQYIVGLSEQIYSLRKFSHLVGQQAFLENTEIANIAEAARAKSKSIKKTLEHIQKQRGYEAVQENFTVFEKKEIDPDILEDLKNKFTIQKFNEELVDLFPYISDLLSEDLDEDSTFNQFLIRELKNQMDQIEYLHDPKNQDAWTKILTGAINMAKTSQDPKALERQLRNTIEKSVNLRDRENSHMYDILSSTLMNLSDQLASRQSVHKTLGGVSEDMQPDDGQHYNNPDNFFSKFSADDFDEEEVSDDGMEIRGYNNGNLEMIFRYDDESKTSGWGNYSLGGTDDEIQAARKFADKYFAKKKMQKEADDSTMPDWYQKEKRKSPVLQAMSAEKKKQQDKKMQQAIRTTKEAKKDDEPGPDDRAQEPWDNPRDEAYDLMLAVKAAPSIKMEPFDKGSITKAIDGVQNQIKELEKATKENPKDKKTQYALEKAQARLGLLQARSATADPKATNVVTKNALTIEHLSTHVKDDKISLLLSRISDDYPTMSKEEQREVNGIIKLMMSKVQFVPMFSAESTTFEELENLLIKREDDTTKENQKIDPVSDYERLLDSIIDEESNILSADPDVQRKALEELNQLMDSHFPAGTNGVNAIESLRDIIDDPELNNKFKEVSQEDSDTCVRPLIMDWIKEKAPQLESEINTGDMEQPETEDHVDSMDNPNAGEQEIEEYVKSLYDTSTGNFPRGETGVLVSVSKKFGDTAVETAKRVMGELNSAFDENLMRLRKLSGVS